MEQQFLYIFIGADNFSRVEFWFILKLLSGLLLKFMEPGACLWSGWSVRYRAGVLEHFDAKDAPNDEIMIMSIP